MIRFVQARPDDVPVLGQLRQQCWSATYRGVYPDAMIDQFDYKKHAERDLAEIHSSRFDVRLILDDDQTIGYLTMQDGTPPVLRSLYLLPAWQRQGIGQQAFTLMRSFARQQGANHFVCCCQPENAGAIAFYRQMGGIVIDRDLTNEETYMNSLTFRFSIVDPAVPTPRRCRWCNERNPLYVRYHDTEWGVPCHDDRALFELLILEGFQTGLSWECVLNKREAFRESFDQFDWDRIENYDDDKVAALLADPRIIRNRLKVRAAIRNAAVFREIRAEFGTFDAYLTRFTGGRVIIEHDRTTSDLSDRISRDLHRRGMRFVGSTIIYAYLQAIGAINSHEPGCELYPGG